MTIFYFTSTGNCLSVAKTIGGKLLSIPQELKKESFVCKDDAIGLVFPIYGFGLPKIVKTFLEKAKWQADYIFAIGTYGNMSGAALVNLKKYGEKLNINFNYLAKIIMVDNYLPGFEIEDQLKKLPARNVPGVLGQIKSDIEKRVNNSPTASIFEKASTSAIQSLTSGFSNGKEGKSYLVDEKCTKCGICTKVCPAKNIAISDRPVFGDQCIACLGCVHNCPQNAIHLKNEKSAARFRNAEVSAKEIIAANNQI